MGWMDRQVKWTDIQTKQWMDGYWVCKWTDRCEDGWINKWQMDKCMYMSNMINHVILHRSFAHLSWTVWSIFNGS